jgi:hypothetical protein
MKVVCARTLIVMAALAALSAGLLSQTAPTPSTQTAPASNSPSQSTTAAKPKPKKPDEPVDPNDTAGVRGTGATHTVRVLLKSKPADGAHVVVKNTNGTVAGACFTTATGECQVEIGADSYVIDATKNGRAGTVSMPVDDTTGPIVIKLAKVKPPSTTAHPQTP